MSCGLRYPAFREEDIDETVRELQSLGIETELIHVDEFTHKRNTFFKDTDGLPPKLHG